MPATVRTPAEIVNTLAGRRGLVTPVPSYFPLGASFTDACIREAYRDVLDVLADSARQRADRPEVTAALKGVVDLITSKLQEE